MNQNFETNLNQIVPPPTPIQDNLPIVPIGAKIIAILQYLISIILIFAGILLVITIAFVSFRGFGSLLSVLGFFGLSVGITDGILAIAWGILHFIAGRGLWMGKKWGQVLAVTISGLYVIAGTIDLLMFGGANYIIFIIFFATHLTIILYLLFSRKVHAAFPSGSLKSMGVILAIIAIVIYASMAVKSYQSKTQAKKLLKDLQAAIERTDRAIKQSGMDCKFFDYKNYDERDVPFKTDSGNGIYSNSIYNFQLNLGQAYVVKESRGVDYCEHAFVFYKPEDTNFSGRLASIFVKPAEGDLNYIYDKDYKYDKKFIQKSNTQIAGQPAFKIVRTTNTNFVSYIFVYKGKLYTISNIQSAFTSDQLSVAVASLQLTQTSSLTSQARYFQIKEWDVEFQIPSDLTDLTYVLSSTNDFVSFSTQSLMNLDRLTAGNDQTYCDAKNNPVGGIAGDSQMIERFASSYKTIGDSYFYRFVTPQATCSDNQQVQALAEKIRDELAGSFQTLRKISNLEQ